MKNEPSVKAVATILAIGVILFVGFWGTVIYVAHHFITKFW